MKWKLVCYCLVLSLLFFACENNKEKGSLKLKVVEEITFETDSLVPINPGYIQFLETDFDSQIFLYNYFVREDGLCLSRNNLFHADYDEGVFRYLVVRFEKE